MSAQVNNPTDGGMTFGGNGKSEEKQGVYLIPGGNNYGQVERGSTAEIKKIRKSCITHYENLPNAASRHCNFLIRFLYFFVPFGIPRRPVG